MLFWQPTGRLGWLRHLCCSPRGCELVCVFSGQYCEGYTPPPLPGPCGKQRADVTAPPASPPNTFLLEWQNGIEYWGAACISSAYFVCPGSLLKLQDTNADIQQQCPLLGQRVVLRGLSTATLNGTRGTAIDFGCSERNPKTGNWIAASGRYTVRLDGPEGRLVKVRAANVAAAD